MGRKHFKSKGLGGLDLPSGLLLPLFILLSPAFMVAIAASGRHPILGLLALIPLLRAIQTLAPSRAALLGGLWGGSLFTFAMLLSQPLLLPSFPTLLLLILAPAAYAAAGSWVTRRAGFRPFVLAVCWILVESVLQPVAAAQGLFGATHGSGMLQAVGGFLGYSWVAFIIVFLAGLLLTAVSRIQWKLSWLRPLAALDHACRWLCQLSLAFTPRAVPCAAHPRAPPAGG